MSHDKQRKTQMENSRREGKRGRLAAAGLSHFVAGESGRTARCVQNDSRMEARGGRVGEEGRMCCCGAVATGFGQRQHRCHQMTVFQRIFWI